MRTTIRIDDDLLERLKLEARKENISLTRLVNRAIKAGLTAGGNRKRRHVYKERTYDMGAPSVSLDKALALAATLDDEEIVRKLMLRK